MKLGKHYIIDDNGCWLWQGSKDKLGYGKLNRNGLLQYAHRYSYHHNKGPITKDMCVCHSCDVRNCVNPDHLWLGTQAENMYDRFAKGRIRVTPVTDE